MLGCDPDAIDSLLRHDLVEPAGGAVDYRCAQGRVVVMFAAIDRLTSGQDPDAQRGYVSELEVSVWCLAAEVSAGSRLVWYLPYVFVDSGQAVASGREVYGYPKQMGAFEDDYPDRLSMGGTTTVEALAIDPYDPDTQAVRRPMISAERLPHQLGTEAVVGVGTEAFNVLVKVLSDDLHVRDDLPFGPGAQPSGAITPIDSPPPSPVMAPTVPAWAVRRVLDTLLGRGLGDDPGDLIGEMVANPMLAFLKQFRDVSCPTKACYQAVIEAPLAIDPATATYEALDPGLFRITVEDWASHPIATDVGLAPVTSLQPEAAFRAVFDFEIQLGLEVWRAPT